MGFIPLLLEKTSAISQPDHQPDAVLGFGETLFNLDLGPSLRRFDRQDEIA